MIELTPFRQRSGFCGPASLKIVLDYYGIKKSERELAKKCKCTAENGTGASNLLKTAKDLGLEGFIKDFSSIKELKKQVLKEKRPVIVDWFLENGGHYSVVAHIDDENVYLQDPSLGCMRAVKVNVFRRVWFDFPGDYMKSKDDLILRRMIVLYK